MAIPRCVASCRKNSWARPRGAQLLAGYNILGACGDSILAPRRIFWCQRRSIPSSWRSALRSTKPTVSQPLAGCDKIAMKVPINRYYCRVHVLLLLHMHGYEILQKIYVGHMVFGRMDAPAWAGPWSAWSSRCDLHVVCELWCECMRSDRCETIVVVVVVDNVTVVVVTSLNLSDTHSISDRRQTINITHE